MLENKCKQCGSCCHMPPSLTMKDIKSIANYMKMSIKSLFDKYLVSIKSYNGDVTVFPAHADLADLAGGNYPISRVTEIFNPIESHCIFLKENKCTIHQVKPEVCGINKCWDDSSTDIKLRKLNDSELKELGVDNG